MATIAFIGAGSTVFARNLIGDILSMPALAESTLALHDIDPTRLATTEIVAHRIADTLGVAPRIEATTDRRRALDGAHHVVTMFQVGGYEPATVTDFEIPARHGLHQTIGDTLGIGGIMRGVRTIPVLLDLCTDMEEIAADATLLNYVNPMAMLCRAVDRASSIRTVGLCHSVQGTAAQLADDLGVPADEVRYRCAGINHMAFYLTLERATADGTVDLYPLLAERAREPAPKRWDYLSDEVRYEVFRRFGYFVTESSEHLAEYVPWFVKRDRPDLIERFGIPLDEYLRRCEWQIDEWESLRQRLEDPDSPFEVRPSEEYGAGIIHSLETGEPREINGNVANRGLIDNLPAGCCVEVPCTVDGDGIHPQPIGSLPPQLAALMQTNINVQELTVEAVLTGRRDHVHHAALLDPHTAAELDPEQIAALVDELLAAHGDLVPAPLRSSAGPPPA